MYVVLLLWTSKMDPMGSVPAFLKSKMTASKPMLLHTLRGILDKEQKTSATDTDGTATPQPATLEGETD